MPGANPPTMRAFGGTPNSDRRVLALFLRYGYTPAPYSIYRNVFKLTSACIRSIPSAIVGQPGAISALADDRPAPITWMWQQHLAGAGNWRFQLWPFLMFQAWKEQWC